MNVPQQPVNWLYLIVQGACGLNFELQLLKLYW